MCYISHMAMECVAYNVYVRLLTYNIMQCIHVAMVLVVDLQLCSLANSHHFLVIFWGKIFVIFVGKLTSTKFSPTKT